MDRFVEFQDVCKYYQMGSQRIAPAALAKPPCSTC